MYRIGEFARIARVSVKTLRFYDQIGLLRPVATHARTGYRFYSSDQFGWLNRILVLKDLGFSLEEIARLLKEGLRPDELRGMLRMKQMEILSRVAQAQDLLALVEARLELIEEETRKLKQEVRIKTVEALEVMALSSTLSPDEEPWQAIGPLFERLESVLSKRGIRSLGPWLALYEEEDGQTKLVAAVAVPQKTGAIPNVELRKIEGSKMTASIVHKGRPESLQEAYRALNRWLEANGYNPGTPVREIFLTYGGISTEEQVIEVQIPFSKPYRKEKRMEPRIVKKREFQAIGLRYLGKNLKGEISDLWMEFNKRAREIPNLTLDQEYGNVAYGLCGCVEGEEPGVFEYIACLPVSSLEKVPEGMAGKAVPAQTYAVMEARGIKEIGPTYDYIIKQWLPVSGYLPGDGPDFELYPEEFKVGDPDSSPLFIFFPVKEK